MESKSFYRSGVLTALTRLAAGLLFITLAAPAEAANTRHITSGPPFFGCTNKDTFTRVHCYLVNRDMDAFGDALAERILSGACTKFEGGEAVFLTDTAVLSGLVRSVVRVNRLSTGRTSRRWIASR
jgi:hypothetical protein